MKLDNIKYNQRIKARVLNTAQFILDNKLTVRDLCQATQYTQEHYT